MHFLTIEDKNLDFVWFFYSILKTWTPLEKGSFLDLFGSEGTKISILYSLSYHVGDMGYVVGCHSFLGSF